MTYRDVPNFPGYRISDNGNLWSCHRIGPRNGLCENWRLIKPFASKGYLYVGLTRNRKVFKFGIHQLVLMAFISPRPNDMDACHNNGKRSDNRLENLRWDTRSGNLKDMARHGTLAVGTRTGKSKLTEDNILEIRALSASGISQRQIGARFGVSNPTICNILHRKKWKHVV